jgi:hypothetical protein
VTPKLPFGPQPCNLCLGREPKARVATIVVKDLFLMSDYSVQMLIIEPLTLDVVVVSVAIVVVVIIVASTLDAFSSSIVFKILVNGTTYVMTMNFWFILTTKVEMPYIEKVLRSHVIFCPYEYRA